MLLQTDIEYKDEYFAVEGYMNPAIASTHDYCGDPEELDYITIYNDQGCDVTKEIGWELHEQAEQSLYDLYECNR